MFAHAYQSGSKGVELVSPSGTEKGCSLLGSNVSRVYDRGIKGYLFQVARGSGGIQCPASVKDTLAVTQPLLVLQIQTCVDQKVTVEVVILDQERLRHRLVFSSSFRHAESNQLHVQLPWTWSGVEPGNWCNLVLDLDDLTRRFFRAEFSSLDSFCIRPVCLIRKVFTLPSSAFGRGMETFPVPPLFDFPSLVPSTTVFFSAEGHTATTRGAGLGGTALLQPELGIKGIPLMCRREATAESGAIYKKNRAGAPRATGARGGVQTAVFGKSPGGKSQRLDDDRLRLESTSPSLLIPLPSPPLLTSSQAFSATARRAAIDPPAPPPPQPPLPIEKCEIRADSSMALALEASGHDFLHSSETPPRIEFLLSCLAMATKRLRDAERAYGSEFG